MTSVLLWIFIGIAWIGIACTWTFYIIPTRRKRKSTGR